MQKQAVPAKSSAQAAQKTENKGETKGAAGDAKSDGKGDAKDGKDYVVRTWEPADGWPSNSKLSPHRPTLRVVFVGSHGAGTTSVCAQFIAHASGGVIKKEAMPVFGCGRAYSQYMESNRDRNVIRVDRNAAEFIDGRRAETSLRRTAWRCDSPRFRFCIFTVGCRREMLLTTARTIAQVCSLLCLP